MTKSKYIVDYISSTDDDVCHVWTEAYSEDDAIDYAKSEYWDIKEIIGVHKAH